MQDFNLLRLCEPYGNLRRLGLIKHQAQEVFLRAGARQSYQQVKRSSVPLLFSMTRTSCVKTWQFDHSLLWYSCWECVFLFSFKRTYYILYTLYTYIYIFVDAHQCLKYCVYPSLANSLTVWQVCVCVCLCWLILLFAALRGRNSTCFVSSTEGSNTRLSYQKQLWQLWIQTTTSNANRCRHPFGDLCCVC